MTDLHKGDPQELARSTNELAPVVAKALAITRRRRFTFAWVFLLAAALVILIGFFWPSTYRADASLLLQKNRFTDGAATEPGASPTVMSAGVSEEEVNSEMAVLLSREVLEATIESTKLDQLPSPWYMRLLMAPLKWYDTAYAWFHAVPEPTPKSRALASLAGSLDVSRLKDSNILVVSFRGGEPNFAEAVLNALLRHYLDRHVDVHGQTDVGPFFTEQTATLEAELERLQRELQDVKTVLDVADLGTEREAAMRVQQTLDDEALTLQRHAAELDGRIGAMRRTIGELSTVRVSTTTRAGGEALEAIRARLLQLQLERIQLDLKYAPGSPLVVANEQQVDATKKALDDEQQRVGAESTSTVNPSAAALEESVAQLTAERQGVSGRLRALEVQRRGIEARVAELDARTAEMERMQLKLQSAKERYLMYLSRAERARVDAALDRARVSNVSVVQWASALPKPVAPKRSVTLVLAAGGGLAIALLVCAWLELSTLGLANVVASTVPQLEAGHESHRLT